jgi:hypothetical protein
MYPFCHYNSLLQTQDREKQLQQYKSSKKENKNKIHGTLILLELLIWDPTGIE